MKTSLVQSVRRINTAINARDCSRERRPIVPTPHDNLFRISVCWIMLKRMNFLSRFFRRSLFYCARKDSRVPTPALQWVSQFYAKIVLYFFTSSTFKWRTVQRARCFYFGNVTMRSAVRNGYCADENLDHFFSENETLRHKQQKLFFRFCLAAAASDDSVFTWRVFENDKLDKNDL